MNPVKCDDHDCIHFVIAAQRAFSCTEAARCQPADAGAPPTTPSLVCSRDSLPTPKRWGERRKGRVNLNSGLLVLDKPYARCIDRVTRHWSGKHHRVVQGVNLVSMVWTDGKAILPCDFRVCDKPLGGRNKNERFRSSPTDRLTLMRAATLRSVLLTSDAKGRRVHLRGHGFIKVFRTVSPDGDVQHFSPQVSGIR